MNHNELLHHVFFDENNLNVRLIRFYLHKPTRCSFVLAQSEMTSCQAELDLKHRGFLCCCGAQVRTGGFLCQHLSCSIAQSLTLFRE